MPIFLAIANLGAFINLFNLLPFSSLDGGRAFRSMSQNERWLAVLGLGVMISMCEKTEVSGLLSLLMLGGIVTALAVKAPKAGDRTGLAAYLALAAALTFILEQLAWTPLV